MKTTNPVHQTTWPASKLALPAAAVFLALRLTAVAQSWQTILPSPAYSWPGPTGRSILVGPATLPDGTPELHLGMQTSPGNPSVLRFRPDDASFADGDIEFVDNRLSWVQDLLHVPGDGIYAVGEATIQSKRQSVTRWVVRRSSTGDTNTWADVGTPYVHPSKSPGDSVATAIVADPDPDGMLFVAGQAIGGQGKESGSRWIVRRKLAAAPDSAWETVLDRFIGYDIYLRPGLCLIPGAGQNGAPVLFTSAHIDTRWAILRSLNGGDSWQLVDDWPEAAGAANARRIEFDPVTGHVYAVGWRGNWITGRQGWVVRRSVDAGNTWETLLDEPTDDWLAAIGVAFGSDGSVLVLGEDRSPDGFSRCVVLRNAPGSIGSATWERMYPFSITDASGTHALYSVGSAIKADAFGNVFVIGRVHNWEANGVLYPDGHLGLTRLQLLP
jgi:hypothetical protein